MWRLYERLIEIKKKVSKYFLTVLYRDIDVRYEQDSDWRLDTVNSASYSKHIAVWKSSAG